MLFLCLDGNSKRRADDTKKVVDVYRQLRGKKLLSSINRSVTLLFPLFEAQQT